MAQPPLSRTIRQLETRLGTRLFSRTTRSVSLTSAGSALIRPAIEILGSLEAAERAVKQAEMGDVGTVRIGYAGADSYQLIAGIVKAVKEEKPGISLVLRANVFTFEATTQLMENQLDVALLYRQALPTRLSGYPIDVLRPVVIVPNSHRFASRESIGVEELRDEPLITLPPDSGSSLRENLFHWCHEAGFKPSIIQDVPDSQSMVFCVATGAGLAVTFDNVAQVLPHDATATVPLNVDYDPVPFLLAYREDDSSAVLREVLKIARRIAPPVNMDDAGRNTRNLSSN